MLSLALSLGCAPGGTNGDDLEDEDSAEVTTSREHAVAWMEELGVCGESRTLTVPAPTADQGQLLGIDVIEEFPDGHAEFTDFGVLLDGVITVSCTPESAVTLTTWTLSDSEDSTDGIPQARVEELGACPDSDTFSSYAPLEGEGRLIGVDIVYNYDHGLTSFVEGATMDDRLISLGCSSGVTATLTTWFLVEPDAEIGEVPQPLREDLGTCVESEDLLTYAPTADEGLLTGLNGIYTHVDGRSLLTNHLTTLQDGVIATGCSAGVTMVLTQWVLPP